MSRIALVLLLAWSSAALGGEPSSQAESAGCAAAIVTAERSGDIPAGLLAAIAQVESGRPDPVSGVVRPWPWTIDAGGAGHFFASKTEAVAAAQGLQAQGIDSIDVGCMQVNLAYHPAAFATLDEAFNPLANTLYAARFLRALFSQTGDWPAAVAAYHSQTREVGATYRGKVLAVWSPGSVPPLAADARSPRFVIPDWIGGSARDRRWPSAIDGEPPLREGAASVPAPAWIERVIAAVARCAAAVEFARPTDGMSGDAAAAWKPAGICPSSPFGTPAALRQLLVQPGSSRFGRRATRP